MKSDLIFENENYILPKRASDIYGYSPSYMRELCDSGVLKCTHRDDVVYVSEDSVKSHKLGLMSARVNTRDVTSLMLNLTPLSGKMVPQKGGTCVKSSRVFTAIVASIFFVILLLYFLSIIPANTIQM